MYYKEMAKIIANRAFEMMISGSEILVTDPGRDVRNVFLAELKELSGTNSPLPFAISKESMAVEPKEVTMAKLWAAQAQFLDGKVPTGGVVVDTSGKSSPEYINGFSLWL